MGREGNTTRDAGKRGLRRVSILLLMVCGAAQARVVLPIEVVGADGSAGEATFEVSADRAGQVRSLFLQIHGIAYADMISVQINGAPWISLSNNTVAVAEPGKSYGGIGGGFGTLKMTMPVPANAIVAGENSLRFRFNRSDGLTSGFRVLAFNLITNDGARVLPDATFEQDDPAKWLPPRPAAQDIAAGRNLWYKAALVANDRPGAMPIRSHCADCHAQDGRDLKYFNFSNASIAARSRFHGLTAMQGEQVASYIRSLDAPNPGRPWNPPYQPGPGLDAQPVANWAAGAGLAWALDRDEASLPYLFPGQTAGKAGLSVTPEIFRPDGSLNAREIPVSLQLPDWNHWLPRVHPLDAWGGDFSQSEVARLYEDGLRPQLSANLAKIAANGDLAGLFDKWGKAQKKFLARLEPREAGEWTQDLGNKVYSTQLWQLVKAWELAQEFHLEERGKVFFGAEGDARAWPNTIALGTAPVEAGIPDGPAGVGATALTNEYFNNSWYELQLLLNNGNHRRHGRQPIDWLYVIYRFRDLQRASGRPEPARLLIATIKALQSSDAKTGPENPLRGWRPEATVDPRIMVSADWGPAFQTLPAEVKRAITEAMLEAWLDKNLKYRTEQYFALGKTAKEGYIAPKEFAEISGGNTWQALAGFQAAGVSETTLERLRRWGKAYSKMADALRY